MATPASAELVNAVKKAIAFVSPRNLDADNLPDTKRMQEDCGIYEYGRKTLAAPFDRIAKVEAGDSAKPVKRSACAKLTTVKAAIKLVADAAGRVYS